VFCLFYAMQQANCHDAAHHRHGMKPLSAKNHAKIQFDGTKCRNERRSFLLALCSAEARNSAAPLYSLLDLLLPRAIGKITRPSQRAYSRCFGVRPALSRQRAKRSGRNSLLGNATRLPRRGRAKIWQLRS
jgi:hypothetical protein